MPYLIDGHNLIAAMPGMHLGAEDDEAQLIGLLRAYCERTSSRATVYFDRGHPTAGPSPSGGRVTACFVPAPRSADQAIIRHLARLGGEARNWTVVSSDREIQLAASRAGARRLVSREFAAQLQERLTGTEAEKPDGAPSREDVAYWEKRFRRPRRHP